MQYIQYTLSMDTGFDSKLKAFMTNSLSTPTTCGLMIDKFFITTPNMVM